MMHRHLPGAIWLACLLVPALGLAQQIEGSGAPIRAASGSAIDWSMAGRMRLGIEGDINPDLEAGVDDTLLTQALEAGLILDAETKRALFTVGLGLSGRYFIGDASDLGGTGRFDPSLALGHSYTGKTFRVETDLDLAVTRAAFSQVGDTGTSDAETSQFTVNYATSLIQQIGETDAMSVALESSYIDFSEDTPDLIPTFIIGANTGWSRQVSETSAIGFSAGFRHFRADDEVSRRSQTLDLLASLDHRRTARHSLNFSLGVSGIRTTETGRDVDFDIGFTGGAALDYVLGSFAASASFEQSIEPSSEGRLEAFSRFSSALGYQINDRERADIALSYSRRTPFESDEGTRDFFSIGPSYNIELTGDSGFSIGYNFRLSRDDIDGLATGHQIFAFLEWRFDRLP